MLMASNSPRGMGAIAGRAASAVSNSNGLLVKLPSHVRPKWSVANTLEAKYA